jgi:hypothetical protein
VNKSNKHVLESLTRRVDRVRSFLTLFKPGLEYDVVSIQDVYGPTAVDQNIRAIVVSKETLGGATASRFILPLPYAPDSDLGTRAQLKKSVVSLGSRLWRPSSSRSSPPETSRWTVMIQNC